MVQGRSLESLKGDFVRARENVRRLPAHLVSRLDHYRRFLDRQGYLLADYPQCLFALAMAEPRNSSMRADAWEQFQKGQGPDHTWFRLLNPPEGDLNPALLQTLSIRDSVRMVAIVEGGENYQVLSASFGGVFCLWDLRTGKLIREYEGPSQNGLVAGMSSNGEYILSGNYTGGLTYWNLTTGEDKSFNEHSSEITAVALSADGRHGLSVSDDNTLRWWNFVKGEAKQLQCHTPEVIALALSSNGGQALLGCADGTLHRLSLEEGISIVLPNIIGVGSLALSSDGRHALSASWNHTLRWWNLESGQSTILPGHTDRVTALALSANDRYAVSSSDDKTVRWWDLNSCQSTVHHGHTDMVTAVVLSNDGRHALSGSWNHTLLWWDLNSGQSTPLTWPTNWWYARILGKEFWRDIIPPSLDLENFSPRLDRRLPDARREYPAWVGAVALSRDRRQALFASDDNTLFWWDIDSGESKILKGHRDRTLAVALSSDGNHAVSGSDDKTLRWWNLHSGEAIIFPGHGGRVRAVALSGEGSHAVSGSGDKTLHWWDLHNSRPTVLSGHTAEVNAVALSHAGQHALSGSTDCTLRWWDVKRENSTTLQGHTGSVLAVALSGDGTHALSGSEDCTLRWWDLRTTSCLAVFPCDYPITSVCLSKTHPYTVVAGDANGRVYFFVIEQPGGAGSNS